MSCSDHKIHCSFQDEHPPQWLEWMAAGEEPPTEAEFRARGTLPTVPVQSAQQGKEPSPRVVKPKPAPRPLKAVAPTSMVLRNRASIDPAASANPSHAPSAMVPEATDMSSKTAPPLPPLVPPMKSGLSTRKCLFLFKSLFP